MNEKKSTVSYNYEAECNKLREEMEYMKARHHEEKDTLKCRVAELEHDLMIFEQKWSVIQLIFGKQV